MSTLKQFREKDTERELELFPDGTADKDVDGRYKLVRLLGRGAMGSVFSAVRKADEGKVAIKIIDRRDVRHQVAVKRFQLEADTAMRINHTNIVKVFERGVCPEHDHFIVMELLKGISLARWMDNKEVPQKDAAYIDRLVSFCIEVCDGLQAAHDKGILHRDIKPSNVFLHGEEIGGEEIISPKILDFGIAKALDLEQTKLTKTGDLCGTSEYIAPEIILGDKASPQSDVYSLGILLYYGLTGTTPFRDAFDDVILSRAVTKECPVPKPSSINPEVPKALESICLKALERDRVQRYGSAVEMGVALRRFRDAPEEDVEDPGTKGNAKIVAAVLVGVVLLIVAAGLIFGLDLFGDPVSPEGSDPPTALMEDKAQDKPRKETEKKLSAPEPVKEPQENVETAPIKATEKTAPPQTEPQKASEKEAPSHKEPENPTNPPKETQPYPAQKTSEILNEAETALSKMKFAEAQRLFSKVISSQPSNARAHYGLGRTHYQQLNHSDAAKSIEKAVKLNPNPGWKTFLGKVYKAMGKQAKAEQIWRDVLKSKPGFGPAERELEKLGVGTAQ